MTTAPTSIRSALTYSVRSAYGLIREGLADRVRGMTARPLGTALSAFEDIYPAYSGRLHSAVRSLTIEGIMSTIKLITRPVVVDRELYANLPPEATTAIKRAIAERYLPRKASLPDFMSVNVGMQNMSIEPVIGLKGVAAPRRIDGIIYVNNLTPVKYVIVTVNGFYCSVLSNPRFITGKQELQIPISFLFQVSY